MKNKQIIKLIRAFHLPSRARVNKLLRASNRAKIKTAWQDQGQHGFNGSIRP